MKEIITAFDTITYVSDNYPFRHFVRQNQPLLDTYLEGIFCRGRLGITYDLILPFEGKLEGSLREELTKYLGEQGEELLRAARERMALMMVEGSSKTEFSDPVVSYADCLDYVLEGNRIYAPGIVMGKAAVLSDYRAWYEALGLPMEDHLFFWLLKVWLMGQSLRVDCEDISDAAPETYSLQKERISLVQKYMDIKLQELVQLRKETGFAGEGGMAQKIEDGEESFAGPNPYEGDFAGKIPVWICWWQGREEMPDMVVTCVESILRNLPEERCEVHFISLENVMEYVTFTPAIIDKFNQEKITYTHLSDLLRAELLFRYGGLWMDATYFVSGPIPKGFWQQDFFTLAFEKKLWDLDLQQGRWTLSLIKTAKGHPAMQWLMEGLWIYWETEEKLVDYFTVDYCLDVGYRHFDVIRDAVDGCKKSSGAVYDLQLRVNQAITPAEVKQLREENLFYKLNRRNEYREINRFGKKTVYGYMRDLARGDFAAAVEGMSDDKSCDKFGDGHMLDGKEPEHCAEVVSVSSLAEYLEAIREVNPVRILDRGCLLAKWGCISRMSIPDMLFHEVMLVGSIGSNADGEEQRLLPGQRVLYDEIVYGDAIKDSDIREYDLILALRH